MRRMTLLRSVAPRLPALQRMMGTSAAAMTRDEEWLQASKMVDSEPDVYGYANFPGAKKQIADLNVILGHATVQDPYLLPAFPANGDMKSAGKDLRENGAVAIKGAISPEAVAAFAAEHRKLVEMVEPELTSDKMIPRGKNFYKAYSKMEGGLQLRANAPGRFELAPLDRRDGGTEVKERTRIAELVEPLVCPPAVAEVMDYAMDTPWRVSLVGSLPTEPNAPAGNWHRDTGAGLFGDEELELTLPDYFFTALLPLDGPLTVENGSECVLGSHRKDASNVGDCVRATCTGEPGDVILLNGKTVHRGLPNAVDKKRPMIYVVYSAHWYQQLRDIQVEYWQGGLNN